MGLARDLRVAHLCSAHWLGRIDSLNEHPTRKIEPAYRGLSVSPQTVIVAPGYAAPPSEVEDLIAGRKREGGNLVYQAVFKRLIRGEKDVEAAAVAQNLLGNGGPLT